MRISIAILPIDVIRSVIGSGNIIGNQLVLYNEDNLTWYGIEIELIGSDPTFGPAVAIPNPSPLPNHTVTLECLTDSTTHVVGVMTDEGGQTAMYTDQTDAGTPGENLVLSGFTLTIFKDDGGAYTAVPS